MNMLIETLGMVGSHWTAWIPVVLITLAACYGVVHIRICPHINGTADVAPKEAASRLNQPYVAGPSFFIVMALGISAMLVGLVMTAKAELPVAAFLILASGIVIVQVAPIILRLREAYDRVMAAHLEGTEAVQLATERLRDLHLGGIAMSLGIAAMMAVGLLAF
ncbi:MAG: hypothetical protein AAF899_02180 [Pseudomonadota bacterium]